MNKKNLAVLGGGLITLSAIGAIVCSSITIYTSNKVSKRVYNVQNDVTALSRAYIKEEEKSDDPEYVTIADQYEIKDTSAISNAYINKDDSKLTSPEDKETLKMASDLLSQITNDKMSLYEKELAIHDWLATNIHSPEDNLSSVPTGSGPRFTPYGVLKYRKSVCVGYATTFKLLMNMLGAECMVEHNFGLGHSWDVVKLDDNKWYIVDVYSDASSGNEDNGSCTHQNFNITNDILNSTDAVFDTSLYPVADGTQYSYAAQNCSKLDDIKKLPKLIKEHLDNGALEAYYELPKNTDYKYLAAIVQGVSDRSSDGMTTADYIIVDKDTTILSLSFPTPSDNETAEKNYPDLTKQLDQLFGNANPDDDSDM